MAITYSITPPSSLATGTNKTNVVNVPNDHFLNAPDGKITSVSGAKTIIEAGTNAEITANTDVKIGATTGIVNVKSYTDEVTVDAATKITFTANEKVISDAPITQIKENTELGSDLNVNTTKFVSKVDSNIIPVDSAGSSTWTLGSTSTRWGNIFSERAEYFSTDNVWNQYSEFGTEGRPYDPTDIYDTAVNRKKGAVYVAGGVGIEKDLNVGGRIYGRVEIANTSFQLVITATNADVVFHPIFARGDGEQFVYVDIQGIDQGLTYNPYTGKLGTELLKVLNTQTATATTGSVRVEGGISVGKNIVAKEVSPHEDAETAIEVYGLGNTSTQWAEAYVHNLYSKVIASTDNSNIEIKPQGGVTDLFGDIRVRGQNPIGTAPVVTNILYVTMDGDDTNDGRAMDPSRACRTVGGAINSPYYQSGTQIRVAPGHYLEDNPLQLKPYTSIMGSDLRTCSIEPINKTQDLFHMNSGCYMAFMQFLNGRSGLLEGAYTSEFNRGAYCTSFPPLEGDARIDLFHSPYIQNCTNLSGPWLKDGTMFVPNQTVQIPSAVGMGTWDAGASSIFINVSTGTITQGMSINAGQQNHGFFDARTLMLANKPFLQEQVVAYVDATFNSGSFTYNSAKCQRDISVILDSISMDVLYNSTSDSTFAGLQYWAQTTSAIAGEVTTTTAAINYLKGLAATVALNAGGATPQTTVNNLFTTITNIITNGTVGVTDWINSNPNGIASTNANTVASYAALISNKATLQGQVLSWITANHPTFVYNTSTCFRDVGYMVDSVAFDLLHGGKKQSIKSGVYYYNYSSTSTQIVNEIPQTTAAYNYLKSIIPNIVTGVPLPTVYQTGTTQVIIAQPIASTYEANALQDKIDIITNIIRRGPDVSDNKTPIDLDINPSEEALNAFNMLLANKNFIKAEVIAYIDQTSNTFEYSKEYCYRDVGILVENISYDAAFGGNQKAIESGLAYYNGVISKISGQESQTSSAIDYLNQMVQSIITNSTWTNILSVPPVISVNGTHSQVRNTVLVDGDVAGNSIDSLFNIITTIINNGPDAAPEMYKSPGPDAAFVSAEILLQANRRFIQEDTINYINNLVKEFPYSRIACKRDVGLIVDSISHDLLYPTTTRSQSTFAGLQYLIQDSYTGDILAQIGPTIDAVTYLRDLSIKIVKNITYDDDLINRYQFAVTQDTSLEPATIDEVTTITANFNIILEILSGNRTGWTDRIVSNGPASSLEGVKNAYDILIANKAYLAAEVIAYVNAIHPDFTYNSVTCARDVGLITNSIVFDLMHGGNRQSIQSGLSYYTSAGSTSTIHGQETQTIVAFNRIKDIVGNLLIGSQVIPSTGTNVSQVISANTATITEVNYVQSCITTITNIIIYGATSGPTGTALTATSVTAAINGFNILQENRKFIVDDVIHYIDWAYNRTSFDYNEELCYRDTGLIVDAVSQDILLGGNYKSVEAGLAYWNFGYNHVTGQETTTTMAINHARDISLQIIANTPVTPQTGTNITQVINTFFQYGGDYMPQEAVARNYGIITNIIENGPLYAPPRYMGGGLFALVGINGADVKSSPTVTSVQQFEYDEALCRRDSGYIIDGVYYDAALGTNYNAVTCGNAYRRGTASSQLVINNELPQTTGAIEYLKLNSEILLASDATAVSRADTSYDEILSIINGGTPSTITFTNPTGGSAFQNAAKDQLGSNKAFIQAETVAWIQSQINGNVVPFNGFTYNSTTCARDVGYIVDALRYDLLYGGNSGIRDCATAYFTQGGATLIPGETSQSVAAFQYMSIVAQQVIQKIAVTPSAGNAVAQSITGSAASGTEASRLNTLITIITDVITAGNLTGLPAKTNPSISWATAGIISAVGTLASGKTALIDDTITYVDTQFSNTFVIGLNTPTVGFGNNATLYFGDTLVYPKQDNEVEELSLELTGSTSTWHQRKVDPIGGMGGSLVDGAVISARSPINSFVYDAFTQLTQGGRGVRITNDGYAQLVSVFTIFAATGVQVDNGGIASIVNSNANFGDLCLVAKGYGKRQFSGTVYNPINKSYPDDAEFNQYYPTGYWPNNARVRIFLPDLADRPHISLVMEVAPPELYTDYTGAVGPYVNEQGFSGFLNAVPNLGILSTGTITLTGIDTTGVAVGNALYIRDQYGSQTGTNGILYVATDTVVTDIGYQSITLNKALTNGGQDPTNTGSSINADYFNLYFCGNAYYTVLSSEVGDNPIAVGTNVIRDVSTGDQRPQHISSLQRLNSIVVQVIKNEAVSRTAGNTIVQTTIPLVTTGGLAETFINQRFDNMIQIINPTLASPAQADSLPGAEAVVKPSLRTKTGPTVQGAGAAINLITENFDFFVEEISAYVQDTFPTLVYNDLKCRRDTKLILQRLIYDIESGGRYNAVMTGLSYWQREGTHHLVQLGENVTRTDLFPDGATVNFYQRSYISASGYVFEYVGAGTNYGALPQVGRADPVQGKETVQLDSGKVFFTSTDQNGDFRIGPGLVISQATGVLSGRTFTKSLFANMTPFILAIEAVG